MNIQLSVTLTVCTHYQASISTWHRIMCLVSICVTRRAPAKKDYYLQCCKEDQLIDINDAKVTFVLSHTNLDNKLYESQLHSFERLN